MGRHKRDEGCSENECHWLTLHFYIVWEPQPKMERVNGYSPHFEILIGDSVSTELAQEQ
jgi:hypothetical protein